eukprot:CAMPEP_0168194624 /NCGR_PEP_ID=MMETSP0139_2-20121125/19338_1 /TAXON_ID=44445 /ORGANISM="Pseudo-nitzschia australis, Strain 10249 10 AB" /LENGTH=918 /DNA_ID=CAMNT_0008118257 /DNA_START=255 /DNA_END=3011 /DNA_ORIENTATION=+
MTTPSRITGSNTCSNTSNLLVSTATRTLFLFAFAFTAPQRIDGLSVPLASDPTNVIKQQQQWDLPRGRFGGVTIPGDTIHINEIGNSNGNSNSRSRSRSRSSHNFFGDNNDDDGFSFDYSPLLPVTSNSANTFSHDYSSEHGYDYYDTNGARFSPSASSTSALSMTSFSPLQVSWKYNNNNNLYAGRNYRGGMGIPNRSYSRPSALSMANYMQNGGPGGSNGNNNGNGPARGPPPGNYNNDYDDYYDNYNRDGGGGGGRGRPPYDDRREQHRERPPRSTGGGSPRGTNRFNTVGGLGSINGANLSRDGRSLQFQNRKDSNTAGRSGSLMDDYNSGGNNSFESRAPNDNYARGGYRQDPRDGHWKDPHNNNGNRYATTSSSSTSSSSSYVAPSSGFTPIPPGDYISAPSVRSGPFSHEPGRGGGGGNVPYDNAYYNNDFGPSIYDDEYNNRNRNSHPDDEDDYYSRNGNVVDNRRRSGGRGAPGGNQNYYNVDFRDSSRRMDRGGGLMNYRPTYNNHGGGGGYGYDNRNNNNNNEYQQQYDDHYDSSGSFYNHEGKRVRRFDPNYDRSEGYYNPDHIDNDSTDPERIIQNKRRRDGRDVKSGANLRRYNPEWDSNQGLYNEASLYGSEIKGTRQYAAGGGGGGVVNGNGNGNGGGGYGGEDMNNRVVPRRRGNNRQEPNGGGWGGPGGRDQNQQYQVRPSNGQQYNSDYHQDGAGQYMDDGYDSRGRDRGAGRDPRYNNNSMGGPGGNQGDDYYDEYEADGRSRRGGGGGARRGLGRRDMDGEREYYRAGDYGGPDMRGDDSMERFRQGKDVKKNDLYGFETGNTPSNKKRLNNKGGDPRMGGGGGGGNMSNQGRMNNQGSNRQRVPMRRSINEDPRQGRGPAGNGGYNNAPPRGSRGGRTNGAGGRDRGMFLDDLNEM